MAGGMEIFKLWGTIEINKGKAVADIKAVDATAEKSSKNIQSNFGNIAKSFLKASAIISGAAAAIGGALFALAVKTSNVADEIDKMSIRTGISRERLQELKYVSSQTGVEFSSLQTSIAYLTRAMYGAEAGSQRQAAAFKRLGINTKDAAGNLRNATEVFDETLHSLAAMTNETERNALALEIFGRGAAELTPLLATGTQGISQLSAKARELGLVMKDDAIAANVKFKDTLDSLKRSFGALLMNLSNAVLPYIQKAVDWTLENLPKIAAVFSFIGEVVGHTVTYIKDLMGIMVDSFKAGFNGAWSSFKDIWQDPDIGFFEKTIATIGKVAGDTVDGIKAGWSDTYKTFSDVWNDPNLNFWEKAMATVSKAAKDTIDGLAEGWKDSYFSFKDIWDNPDLNFVEKAAATISKFFKDGIEGIKVGWSDTYDTFKDVWDSPDLNFVEKVTASISKFFKDSFDGIVAGAAGSYDTFKEIWDNPELSFVEKATATVGKSFRDLFLSLEKGWNDSYNTFKEVWSDPDLNFIEKTGISITKFFKGTWDGLKNGWNQSYQDFKEIWDNPDLSFVEKAATSLSAGAKITIDWAGDLLSNINEGDWDAVYEQVKGVGQNITKYLGEGIKGTLDIFTWISEGLTGTTKNLREGAGAVKDVLKDALKAQLSGEDTGTDFWKTFWDGLVATGGEIGDWFKDVDLRGIIESAVNLGKSIGEFFKEAFLLVVDFVEIMGLAIANVAVATWNGLLVPAAGWIWDGMKGAFDTLLDLGGVVWGAVKKAALKIYEAGLEIGSQLIDAIKYVFGAGWLLEMLGISTGRAPAPDTTPGRTSGGREGVTMPNVGGGGEGLRFQNDQSQMPRLDLSNTYASLVSDVYGFLPTGPVVSALSEEDQQEIDKMLDEVIQKAKRKALETSKQNVFDSIFDLGVKGSMTPVLLERDLLDKLNKGLVEPVLLSALAYAESKYNIGAVGGQGYGPFQFEPIAYDQAKKWVDTPMSHTVAATDPVWAVEAAEHTINWLRTTGLDSLAAALVGWNKGRSVGLNWQVNDRDISLLQDSTKILMTNFMIGLEKELGGDWSKLSEETYAQVADLANIVNQIITDYQKVVERSFPGGKVYTFDIGNEIAEVVAEILPETHEIEAKLSPEALSEVSSILDILREIKEAILSKDLNTIVAAVNSAVTELIALNNTTSTIHTRLGIIRDHLWEMRTSGAFSTGAVGQDIKNLGEITKEQTTLIEKEFKKMADDMISQTDRAVDEVLQSFMDLYMELVGASIVPDMVKGVGKWMGPGLQDNMVKPTKTAAQATKEYIEGIQKSFEKLESVFDDKTSWWNKSGKTSDVPIFDGLIPDAEETAEEVVGIWKQAFTDISRMFADLFVKTPRRIFKGEIGLFGAIKELVGNLFGKVETLFSDAIAEKIDSWIIENIPQPNFNAETPMLTQLVDMGKLLFTQAGGALAAGVETLVAATGPVGLLIIAAFTNMALKLWAFTDRVKRVVAKIDEIFGISQRIKEGFENEVKPAMEWVTGPFKELGKIVGKALIPVIKSLAPIFEWLANGIKTVLKGIFEMINGMIDVINAIFPWLKIGNLDMTAFDKVITTPEMPNAGRQISEITGPTRDILIDLLSPLASLNSLVGIGNRIAGILDARLPVTGELGLAGVEGGVVINGDINLYPQTADIDEITQLTAQEIERKISESLIRSRRGAGR